MAGYTRQSIADIINGADITAPPLNAEFDQLSSAFSGTTGHAHDGTTGNGPKINLQTSVSGYLPAANGGIGGKNNLSATSNPTATDDSGAGYVVGSMWENVTTGRVFICVGNFANAAVWREITQVDLAASAILPETTNTVDLGSPDQRFQDLWLSAGISALGNASVGGTVTAGALNVTGASTLTGTVSATAIAASTVSASGGFSGGLTGDVVGNVTGNLTGNVTGDITSSGTSTFANIDVNGGSIDGATIGLNSASTGAFTNLSASGTTTIANADINGGSIDGTTIGASSKAAGNFTTLTTTGQAALPTVNIDGGTVDGTTIGNTVPASGAFTTLSATSGITGNVTGNVTGNLTGNVTGNVTGDVIGSVTGNVTATSGTSTFNNLTVNGTMDVTGTTIVNVTDPVNPQDAATKNYVDTGIAALVDTAPGTLDTLNELAAALGDDPNFSTTITNSIATKLPLAGGTMSGAIAMGTNKITGVGDPTANQDAATKAYVDAQDALQVSKSGDSMSGNLDMGSNKVTNVATPTAGTDATNKTYVDGILESGELASASAAAAATSESNAATSATAAANSASAAATSEANADTSEANALTYSSNAAISAAQAASSAAGIAGYDLDAIAATKADTAVDVFVYDTSKDSDGGRWRHRCQHTSWYNETLNTSTRGSRKEFPAVAVIVAESNKVTIYDGDDPALPMWRVTNKVGPTGKSFWRNATGVDATSVSAQNGVVSIGLGGAVSNSCGILTLDFVKDNLSRFSTSDTFSGTGLAVSEDSSTTSLFPASVPLIVDYTVNDVAMTVLPNAPIDAATGLPVPTIAVATDGGVSVIKDDGSVVDLTCTLSGYAISSNVVFGDSGELWLNFGSGVGDKRRIYRLNEIPSSDLVVTTTVTAKGNADAYYSFDETNRDLYPAELYFLSNTGSEQGDFVFGKAAGFIKGLTSIDENTTTPAEGMVAFTTSDYATGWMNGSIKGAFLSDTDTANLVGSGELISNGGFDEDTTGWTVSGQNALITWDDSGYLVLRRNGTSAVASQTIPTVSGETYVISFDLVASSGAAQLGVRFGSEQSSRESSAGTYTFTATASSASTVVSLNTYNTSLGSLTIDNVSVKLADADRSVNNNGLVVSSKTYDPWHDDLNLAFDDESFTVDREASDFMSAITHDASSNATMTGGYGPELVTNGGFDDATGWTAATTSSISGGKAHIYTPDGSSTGVSQADVMEIGKTYEVTLEVSEYVTGSISDTYGSGSYNVTGNGIYRKVYTAQNTTFGIKRTVGITDLKVDNISVREIPKVQWRPHNLLSYSEDFTQSAWTKTDTTVTANAAVAPDGTTTADEFSHTSTSATFSENVNVTSGVSYVTGIFVKYVDHQWFRYYNNMTGGSCWVDLTTNSVGTQESSFNDVTVTPLSNGWVYIQYEWTATTTVSAGQVFLLAAGDNSTGETSGTSAYIWGAHLYRNDLGGMAPVPTDFQTAGSTTYVSTTSSARYLPRIGHHVYNGSAWVNEGLLHESEARTNLLTNSLDISGLVASYSTLTANAATSPDGTADAAQQVENTTASVERGVLIGSGDIGSLLVNGTQYTISAFVKPSGDRNMRLGFTSGPMGSQGRCKFDLGTGEIVDLNVNADSATITKVGNGWWHVSVTDTCTVSSATGTIAIIQPTDSNNNELYTGDGSSGLYIYGLQLEAGPTPSSYIPTSGSTATRASESLTIPAANLPYSSTAMTIQMDGTFNYADLDAYESAIFTEYFGDNNNEVSVRIDDVSAVVGNYVVRHRAAGNDSYPAISGAFAEGVSIPYNIAVRLTSSEVELASDGISNVNPTTVTAMPSLASGEMLLGKELIGTIRNFRMWGNDIKDDGIEIVTQPSIVPSLSLSFDGSEASHVEFDWSEK